MYRLKDSKDMFEAIDLLMQASGKLKDKKLPISNALLDTADNLLKEIEQTKIECNEDEIERIAIQILKKRQHDLTLFERDYQNIIRDNDSLRSYTLEFTTTNFCNWKCEYCFEEGCERHTFLNKGKVPIIIAKIRNFLNSPWFEKNLDVLKLDFWGGEPFINPTPIKKIMEEFMHDERVIFHAYTNGSKIDPLLDHFSMASKQDSIPGQKILIQFSYDGQPIHDMRRIDGEGNPTSQLTLHKAMKTALLGIPISFKATLMIKDFDNFSKAWDDYYQLFKKFGEYGHITYSPTIDYTQNYSEVDLRKDVLKAQLIDIASKELDFFKKEGRFLLSWFSKGSSLCTAGRNMTCVDTDGGMYYCHGAMYEPNKTDFTFGNIYEAGFVNKLIANHERFFMCNQSTPEKCQKCVADSCYRCNVQKHQNSEKSEFMDKWMDFTCMTEMCNYFKLIGEIKFALVKAITGDI